jgi:hypothetical protein
MKDWWKGLQPKTRIAVILACAAVVICAIFVGGPEAVQGIISIFSK